MPENVNWDRLAEEMSANIRVGLAAGECVAPRTQPARLSWQPVMAMAALFVVLAGVLWVNLPRGGQSVAQAPAALSESGPVVEASATGIELKQNGSALAMSQGSARPVAVSVSLQGTARARYFDSDTSQITITSVYVQ